MSRKVQMIIDIEVSDEHFDDLKKRAAETWVAQGGPPIPDDAQNDYMRRGFAMNALREVLHHEMQGDKVFEEGEYKLKAAAHDIEKAYTINVRTSYPA